MTDEKTWTTRLDKLAERYSAAFELLLGNEYPAEANAVAELASMIAKSAGNAPESTRPQNLAAASVLLEAQYWHEQIDDKRQTKRAYADIWRSDPELFVELKLGRVMGNKLGTQTRKTIVSYAYDVWRLLALAARGETSIECAFVIVAFGDNLPDVPDSSSAVTESEPCAQGAYEALLEATSSSAPLSKFLKIAGGDKVRAEVLSGAPVKSTKHQVRCYTLRWELSAPWDAGPSVKLYK